MEYDIDALRRELEKRVPQKRLAHSIGVMDTAVKLAARWGANVEKARAAGLLHDVTKALTYDEQLKLCDRFGIMIDAVERREPKLLHAVTGAYVVRREFKIDDDDIFDAIRYHTTARADMSMLEIAVYLADFIEPGRDFEGVDDVRRAVERGPYEGLLYALDFSIYEVVGKKSMLHPDTIEARNFILKEDLA